MLASKLQEISVYYDIRRLHYDTETHFTNSEGETAKNIEKTDQPNTGSPELSSASVCCPFWDTVGTW